MSQENIRLTQYARGGGCGCKIAPAVLQEILSGAGHTHFPSLLVGNESSDDAAVYETGDGQCVVSTTDFFLPIVDDPFDFGCIASANAISDVYAMGGRPLMAIAILGWPVEKLPVDSAASVMEGARSICAEAGIPLAGGHTIDSAEPFFGLAVTGIVSVDHLKRNNSAKAGDLLLLTKPLGVGILATALKRGLLEKETEALMLAQMKSLNTVGAKLGAVQGVHAMTDVTGFGLIGHLTEMAGGSGLGAQINYGSLQKIDGLQSYLQQRTIPDATFRNWNAYGKDVSFAKGVNVMEAFNLLPDPQTNGGLLVAVDPSVLAEVQSLFKENGLTAFCDPIGMLVERGEKLIHVDL